MKDSLKKFILTNWTLGEKSLLMVDILLFGMLIGWLTSPFRGLKKVFYYEEPKTVDNEDNE